MAPHKLGCGLSKILHAQLACLFWQNQDYCTCLHSSAFAMALVGGLLSAAVTHARYP